MDVDNITVTIGSNKWKIFTGDDFFSWREETVTKFQAIRLWRIISGKEARPAYEHKMNDFEERQEQAYGILMLIISPAHRDCLRSLESQDPAEAWKAINNAYEKGNPDTVAALLETLISIRCNSEDKLPEYLSDFNILNNRITGYKVVIPEILLVVILLKGLPQTFDNFKNVIKVGKEQRNLEETLELIRNEQQSRHANRPRGAAKHEDVMIISAGCSVCGKNHHVSKCWKAHPEKAPKWYKRNSKQDKGYLIEYSEETIL